MLIDSINNRLNVSNIDVNSYYAGNSLTIETLPSWLPKANFSRTQTDLIARNESGEEVVFVDYFTNFDPPSIQTENGLLLKGSLLKALAGPLAPGQYAQAAEGGALSIGEVSTVNGTVNATRLDGTAVQLGAGDPVFQGDTIETVGNGSVGLVFIDKTTLSLSEGGKMVLDELVYDPASGTGSMAVDMVEGAFSFVSGEIAKTGPDSMKVETPVATIGIRGTTVAGKAAVEGNENSFTLLQDAGGGVGQISVSNAGGTQVLSQVGATTSIASFNAAPPPPVILSAAEIQANYGTALNVLPPTPAVAPQPQPAPPPQEEQQEEQQVEEEATEEEGEEEVAEEAAPEEGEGEGEEELAEGEEGPPEGELVEGEEGPPVGPDGEPLAEGEEGPPEGEGGPPEGEVALGPDGEPLPPGEGGPPEGEAPASDEQVAAREAFDTAMAAGATPEQAMAEAAEAGGFNQSISNGPDGLAPPTSGPMDSPMNAPLGNMGMPMPGGMNPFNANPILNAGPVDPMGGPIMGPAFGPGPMMGPAFGPGPMMGPAFGPGSMDMLAGPMSPGDNLPGAVGFGDPLGGPGGGFGPYSNTPEAGPVESYFFDDPSLYNDFFQDLNSSEPQLEGIVGTNSDDTLTGDNDDNTLHGLLGDDTLDGGSGADTLNGGAGDDIYIVDNIEDVINENVNEGTDLIQTSVSFTLPQNVENITLTGTDDINAIGNSSNNIITGNTGQGGGGGVYIKNASPEMHYCDITDNVFRISI